MKALIICGILGLLLPITNPASAEPAKAGVIVVEPWARATPPGARTGAVYMSIRNSGGQPDRLLRIETASSASAEVHTMTMDGGVMRMRSLSDGLTVPARSGVDLRPGGTHLMLLGLKTPLRQGASVDLTLVFDKAGSIRVKAPITPIGAKGPHR